MSDADKAYASAQKLIAAAREGGATEISFDREDCHALTRIPPEIADLTALQALFLTQSGVTDLTPLSPLTGLQRLWLKQTGVTDLAPLSTITGLQALSLGQTSVTDLSPLSPLTGLITLSFDQTGVADLVPLSRLTRLQRLSFDQTGVTDLSPLSPLTGLQALWLNQTGVTDLTPVSPLTGLQILWLEQTAITDLSPLSPLTGLITLALDGTKVTDLRPLRELDRLGREISFGLSFRDTPATARDAELARLAEIEDPKVRADQTRAYLHSLPPWPEPYTPAATPDGSPPRPVGATPSPAPAPKVKTTDTQIRHLLRNALVTGVTAAQLSQQITDALRDVPATHGNELAPPLQMMAEMAEVLNALAQDKTTAAERERALRLRIHHLEAIVARLTEALKDEKQARAAAEAIAAKDGFLNAYRKGLGAAAGVGTVGLIGVGVPTAAVYFLGAEHPLVQALLTVMGRLPKG
jgi:hypothetical protein